jgi:protein involved in polysaccharide export with SLBB domain
LSIKNLFSLLAAVILFCQSLYAQILPDYGERFFTGVPDSTGIMQSYLTGVTDGSINSEEYFVGPGDKLFISISGIQDFNFNVAINQEGFLFIPKIGEINLQNVNLQSAKKIIISAVNKYYKNVDVSISLTDFRKIKVSLTGDVKKPSTYILPGNSRLIDLIAGSSGLTSTANYRNIKIIYNDSSSATYDLLKFFRFADRKDNPLLREGDIVVIDKSDKVVSIRGEVKYPGVYENRVHRDC